jgi:hypothetical protein
MTDPNTRQQLVSVIAQIWEKFPEFRFGQLVCNLADVTDSATPEVEDEELLAVANDFLARSRRSSPPCSEEAVS